MDKTTRHEKAEEFRRMITLPSQRMAHIEEFLKKDNFDTADKIRLTVLFQKVSYLEGCENGYRKLIFKIKNSGDPGLMTKTTLFSSRLNIL